MKWTDAAIEEFAQTLRARAAQDGSLEPAYVSAKLALELVEEIQRLRGLMTTEPAEGLEHA